MKVVAKLIDGIWCVIAHNIHSDPVKVKWWRNFRVVNLKLLDLSTYEQQTNQMGHRALWYERIRENYYHDSLEGHSEPS